MKTLKLVMGLLITIGSSIYLLFCISIFAMATSYGTTIPSFYGMYLFIPILFLLLGIYLIASSNNKDNEELKQYREQEQKQREIYYRNRNYKAKSADFYLMKPKEKLEYYYDILPEEYQQKVVDYAERLHRQLENLPYEPKK